MKNQMTYHITPHQGLINDPNGLVYFKGRHHVFLQWNQTGVTHSNKSWGHVSTTEFVNWQTHPPALEPVDEFDRDGCYSGSAVVHDNSLYLFYTGNLRGENNERITTQCLAISEDGIHFTKKGPIITQPSGYTAHIRDPKVWQTADGSWSMVLGAQTLDLTGTVLLYQSDNLIDWVFKGEFVEEVPDFGFMWECPDVFITASKQALIISPQGLTAQGITLNNLYHSGYFIGQISKDKHKFQIESTFTEFDRGFEFYAPQTYQTDDGRQIMYAWMGLMQEADERAFPTIKEGWIHSLTIPRVLTIVGNRIIQKPIDELRKLRGETLEQAKNIKKWQETLPTFQNEVLFHWPEAAPDFTVNIRNSVTFTYYQQERLFTVYRINWRTQQTEKRSVRLENELTDLQCFMEESSLEIFLNQGQEVFTLRYISQETEAFIAFEQQGIQVANDLIIYPLNGFCKK